MIGVIASERPATSGALAVAHDRQKLYAKNKISTDIRIADACAFPKRLDE